MPVVCQWCGQPSIIIRAHNGYGQCSKCGTNIDECCRGEMCSSPSEQPSVQKNKDENWTKII